ncbi:MAG TPA: hypothetical protein VGB42_03720 [Candidatus Thermoplasmatota archaeon]
MALSASLTRWLLARDADPSVRLRVLTEVLGRPMDDPAVARARKEVGRKGWAAEILARQHPRGQWETPGTSLGELYRPKYISTNWCLLVLADLGVRGSHPRVNKATDLFLRTYAHRSAGIGYGGGEICFTGNAVRMMAKFGRLRDPRVQKALRWVVRAQKRDGGWHCFPSKTGTLDGWEGMAAFAAIGPEDRSPEVDEAIARGADFYLDRGLLQEGRAPYAPWARLHYPVHYYYDLLVGLDFMTALGYGRDRRIRPALRRLEAMRNRDGSWNLDRLHPDVQLPEYPFPRSFYSFGLEVPGLPSRWITTSALSVLRRAGRL